MLTPATDEASPPSLPLRRAAPRPVIPFTDRLLDVKAVTDKTLISRSKLYVMMGQGLFPPSFSLSPQMVRWRESVIDAWMEGHQPTVEVSIH